MAISKAERKRAAATRRRMREATRRDAMERKLATGLGAWGGQKWFAGATTPGTNFPLHYTLGIGAMVLGMRRTTGRGTARLFDLAEGAALGQLAVQGYNNQNPLFARTPGNGG